MASSIRGVHVSPGIYTKETELTYAVKSLGITTLGLVGETQRGRAFEPTRVDNWREFQTYFGGTSTEKFKDTQYPKYELPYIAKSYLSESNQLEVCRVLGLSGYNAGPAWVITLKGTGKYDNTALAVLRSRGYYEPYYKGTPDGANDPCGCGGNVKYDYQRFYVGEEADASCNKSSNDLDKEDLFTSRKFDLSTVELDFYTPINSLGNSCDDYYFGSEDYKKVVTGKCPTCVSLCESDDYGRFNIKIVLSPEFHDSSKDKETDIPKIGSKACDYVYSVSLNPSDKNYILKVLGTNNDDGSAPLYVESLYDVALEQGIVNGEITGINKSLEDSRFAPSLMSDYCKIEPVYDLLTKPEGSLTRSDIGKRFIAGRYANENNIKYNVLDGKALAKAIVNGRTVYTTATVAVGEVYVVKQYTLSDGKRKYLYVKPEVPEQLKTYEYYSEHYKALCKFDTFKTDDTIRESGVVKVNSMNLYYRLALDSDNKLDVLPVTVDLNNYKSQYRYASTPWFVSNVKGDKNHLEVNRLFRFHTISDGNTANYEVKVSIENIMPDEGTFDVVVRNINDTDEMAQPLEKFSKCSLVPGESRYICFKIGTADGAYLSNSKYITVEMYDEGVIQQNSVPAGFLGYPHGFNGQWVYSENTKGLVWEGGYTVTSKNKVAPPVLMYNCNYDEDVKARKQYFGLSSITGVDVDAFTFKGVNAYIEDQAYLTNGFHLDCRLNEASYGYNEDGTLAASARCTVDGEEGFIFDTVSVNARTSVLENAPIIGAEVEMQGSIYQDPKLRKFTAYFCGGFDGWDVYRKSRTNTDDFKLTKYNGNYSDVTGEGYSFDKIKDPESLGLNQHGFTSDWYAYLAGYRQFANPEAVDVNIFATPGIDLINNKLLAEEVIEMIESERADSIYVATLPDKPSGADDQVDSMYTPDDIVAELEDTEIDSNYTCTYYPWARYFDADNSQYILLPVTRDVVKNMAQTDNQSYSWFPPAGLDRGDVEAVNAHYITKLSDEDVLYAGRVNPVKTFAQEGVKIWGQKNLQIEEGQLNRIAVRRLLLRMRKLISVACLSLIFMPNDNQTKQSLQGLITPIMDSIKANRGISDYRIEINSSDATTEDRRELNARILFKPYAALEYINLEFAVTPEGVSFDDL